MHTALPKEHCTLHPTYTLQKPQLSKLNTAHNNNFSPPRLTKVRASAFAGLVSLRRLYLDHNQLTKIPSPTISLNHMHLSNNNITDTNKRVRMGVFCCDDCEAGYKS